MISGRKPFYGERAVFEANELDPREWLVIKVKGNILEIRNRKTDEIREIS